MNANTTARGGRRRAVVLASAPVAILLMTGTASAAGNGVSDNTQSNKPCAGCVGKADNKNPKGQSTSGHADNNAGYECDGNQGIGQGNPAHTGCTPPVDNPPVDNPPVDNPPVDNPPVDNPPVAPTGPITGTATGTATGTPSGSGSGTVTLQSSDGAVLAARPVLAGPAQGLGSGSAAQSPASLPFTGDNTGQLAVFALLLVAAGGGLVVSARRV